MLWAVTIQIVKGRILVKRNSTTRIVLGKTTASYADYLQKKQHL